MIRSDQYKNRVFQSLTSAELDIQTEVLNANSFINNKSLSLVLSFNSIQVLKGKFGYFEISTWLEPQKVGA